MDSSFRARSPPSPEPVRKSGSPAKGWTGSSRSATTTSKLRSSWTSSQPCARRAAVRATLGRGGSAIVNVRRHQLVLPFGRAGDGLRRRQGRPAQRRQGAVAGARPERHQDRQHLARTGRRPTFGSATTAWPQPARP